MNRRSYLAVGLVVLAIGLFIIVNQCKRENLDVTTTETGATPKPSYFSSFSDMYDSSLAYFNRPTGDAKTAPDSSATPEPSSFPSLSSMYDSSLAYVNSLTGGAKTAPDSLAAPEPVEFNWPVIGTIIGVVSVLILVAVFYPSSSPAPPTGARRVKRF